MRQPNFKLDWFIPNQIIGLTHFHADATQDDIIAKGWDEGMMAYNALGSWIETHGFQIAGVAQDLLFTLQTPEIIANSLIEIQFPVIPIHVNTNQFSL
ncbi:MAG: hypothetical protein GY803_28145 [Chloroflexi bacterium]|nr:hypothetical protein [Chloroflexota bacterium]